MGWSVLLYWCNLHGNPSWSELGLLFSQPASDCGAKGRVVLVVAALEGISSFQPQDRCSLASGRAQFLCIFPLMHVEGTGNSLAEAHSDTDLLALKHPTLGLSKGANPCCSISVNRGCQLRLTSDLTSAPAELIAAPAKRDSNEA